MCHVDRFPGLGGGWRVGTGQTQLLLGEFSPPSPIRTVTFFLLFYVSNPSRRHYLMKRMFREVKTNSNKRRDNNDCRPKRILVEGRAEGEANAVWNLMNTMKIRTGCEYPEDSIESVRILSANHC